MKINEKSQLITDAREDFNIRFEKSPHTSGPQQVAERILIIHAPPSKDAAQAVKFAVAAKRSAHLVIGQDGKEIVQTVPFNLGARHTPGADRSSIAIELSYPGELSETTNVKFQLKGNYREDQYILGSPSNSARYGNWLLFPTAQLETLVRVVAAIKKVYTITDVFTREEIIASTVLPTGPAFPILQLRERLTREKLLDRPHRPLVLQEMARDVDLLSQPDPANANLLRIPVPQGAPVLILNERFAWYLVAVMKSVNGNPWSIGWALKSDVKVSTDFVPVVNEDHFLETRDGRGFQHIEPHPNCFEARPLMEGDKPKYIIMHYTTGTKIESTINHFTNAVPGVSTHLLIGRDGRVIQFVPFNLSAHHAGFSWWEMEKNLNRTSIGIELDNAGKLTKRIVNKNVVWMSGQDVPIPDDKVVFRSHWRNTKIKPAWESFTPEQLEVARKIVKALKERYPSIKEILGHDQVNLLNREDPGGLFRMEDWRMELFGRRKPRIKIFYLSKETDLILNFNGDIPNESTRLLGTLPHDSHIMVTGKFDPEAMFTKIKVRQPKGAKSLKGAEGWVKTNSIVTAEEDNGKKRKKKNQPPRLKTKIKGNQPLYKTGGGSPTPPVLGSPFPAGTRVRKQEENGKWTLVVVLDRINGETGIEGWVNAGLVSKKRIQKKTALRTFGVPQGLPLWRHKDDAELGDAAPKRPHPKGDPAVFPMLDKSVLITKQWQFFIRAINFEMSLQHVTALFGYKKAFTNRPEDDLRADYLNGKNLDCEDLDFDKVRTCALSVMTGIVDGDDLLVEMMDGSQPPPLKPGFEYPERVEEIDPDIYAFTPKTHRHLFFVANITRFGGKKISPFPHGKPYPDWTGDERNYTWLPYVAPSKARVRYPLSHLVRLPPGAAIPSPYKP